MKRVLHTAFSLVLIMVLLVGMAPAAQAFVIEKGEFEIPVSISVTGSDPVPGAYVKLVLTSDDGTATPIFLDVINGATYGVPIDISEMGVYKYELSITDGTYVHEDDKKTYVIEVYNLAEGYDDHIVIWEKGNTQNKPEVISMNFALTDIKVAKKWIDQASVRPNSVTAELLLNGERPVVSVMTKDGTNVSFENYGYADVTLNSKNTWQSYWTGVDADLATYSVKEVKVPAGYVATYKYADGVYTITNTGALIQTGQLNWPIPVLCGTGCLFILVGMLMLRRKEEENG